MTQELLKFENLPEVLEKNEALTRRAKETVEQEIKEIQAVSMTDADNSVLSNIENKVKDLWLRMDKALKMNKERRMPFTKRMDEVRSMFTSDEKELSDLSNKLKNILSELSEEKLKRKKKEEEVELEERQKALAKIDFRQHISDQINLAYIDMVNDYKKRIKDKYERLNGEELEEYKNTLKNLNISFKLPSYKFNRNHFIGESEENDIIKTVEKDIFDALKDTFEEDVTEYINSVLSGHDSELNPEKAKMEYEIKKEEEQKEVESQKMDVLFSEPKISDPVSMAKGVSVKMEYDLKSHNDYIEIIKFWVTKDLPNLMIDELKKKLSFMVTAANRELNKGENIKGLETKEAIKIRKTKK